MPVAGSIIEGSLAKTKSEITVVVSSHFGRSTSATGIISGFGSLDGGCPILKPGILLGVGAYPFY